MGLDLVGLIVQDMKASLDFYRALGLEVPDGAEGEDHVEVALPGGLRLAWDTVEVIRSFDPDWKPPTGGARISLAFQFDSPEGVDAKYTEMVRLGYTGCKEPWDAFWGQRYAIVKDPDGNGVDLFAAL